MYVLWEVNNGPWQGPVPFGSAVFPEDARVPVALAKQSDNQLTAMAVGKDERLHVAWVIGNGSWQGPVGFGNPDFRRAEGTFGGTGVALARQNDNQLTAMAVGKDGRLRVAWEVNNGPWQGPVPFGAAVFEPGVRVALAKQNSNQLTAMAVGKDGRLHVAWEINNGPWQGPVPFGNPDFSNRVGVGLALQNSNQLTAMAVGKDGRLHVAWEVNNGPWQGPVLV
ncbi:hypothetical protein ACFT4A_40690 [Streptomyces sp. NPDC057099]|uniref:hypothetical protein n=1 Tax=Streptomyces sp. NPDC057099 TaxID=3346019 RepID=UPI003637D4CB